MSLENITNNWRYNIPIGSRILINNNSELYVFYGYNYNKTIISCFPVNSSYMIYKMIFIPLETILSIYDTGDTGDTDDTNDTYNAYADDDNSTLDEDVANKLKI